MIYEMRVYRLQPGKVYEFEALIEEAMPLFDKYLKLVGWWHSEIAELNEVHHMWSYQDLDHRISAREAEHADPGIKALAPKLLALIESQRTSILVPTDFSPLQ